MRENQRQVLAKFLEVYIPENIVITNKTEIEYYPFERLDEVLRESRPQLLVEKSTIITVMENEKLITHALGVFTVSEDMCRGHFDNFPMLPLAKLAQACCQVGELLVLYFDGFPKSIFPLVIEAAKIRSITDKNASVLRKFMIPGDRLLIHVAYGKGRMAVHKIAADVFLHDSNMAQLDEVTFLMVHKSDMKEERNEPVEGKDNLFRLSFSKTG